MRRRAVRAGLLIQLLVALCAVWAGPAHAAPVSGPHETVDDRLSTTRPNAPAGFSYTGTYHAVGDPNGNPPYMRRMVSYNPPGLRYDTSVPPRCTAGDLALALRGAAACPAGSRLGGGKTRTAFFGRFASTVDVDFLNDAGEQIILARSPLLTTVARGHIRSTDRSSSPRRPAIPASGQSAARSTTSFS